MNTPILYIKGTRGRSIPLLLLMFVLSIASLNTKAQITIGGNVYGGGNAGDTGGSTSVTVRAGDINAVFGGARQADVDGSAYVHIDGKHASDFTIINKVYGGNDIAGSVGNNGNKKKLPETLTLKDENNIDDSWDAFVRVSSKTVTTTTGEGENAVTTTEEAADAQKIYIGQLFGGGNGEYFYKDEGNNHYIYLSESDFEAGKQPIASNTTGFTMPNLDKTYLEILGGSIVYAYGGGNNATVTKSTVICVDNPSKVVNSILDKDGHELLTTDRFRFKMGINTSFSYPSSDAFQIGRFFGGNNKAEMAIRPLWNLKSGKIRNVYSGGNQGDMTSPEGLLLNIDATSKIIVDNLYGGCRMADVCPKDEYGNYKPTTNITGYNFPDEFSARVVISGGDINNVYGGNDISGKVYGGNAVGIRTSVRGNVYGGGNGSYPYTDNLALKGDDIFGDLYYDPDEVFAKARLTESSSNMKSVEALNLFRPNAEQVSIRLVGTQEKPTVVHGSIFCGGNSATIMSDKTNPKVELKIGSYVIADNVFLGNNGENMVTDDMLKHYAGNVGVDGKVTGDGTGTDFSSLDLTDATTFETYMDGAAMRLMPSVVFDGDIATDADVYKPYTTYFGSVYCGGNVGSMKVPGKTTIHFDKPFYIFNKLVGGCNEANIYAKDGLNAEFLGGLLEDAEDGTGDKLELDFNGPKLRPMRWNEERTALEWNTIDGDGNPTPPITSGSGPADDADMARRLLGGNVYGGCYTSGHVNGNVTININETLVERDQVFDITDEKDPLYENDEYNILERRTGVTLAHQGMDVLGSALNVFGGGYGGDSEIWGSTTINLNKGYTFQIFGGGEAGAIGKAVSHELDPNNPNAHILNYTYDAKYSTYINLNGDANLPGVARGAAGDSPDMAECEFIYGGAFEGKIAGDVHVNLNNGRLFNLFAGSCNADILGHVETYIGASGFPWIRDHVYGGNDLGGRILGTGDFTNRVSTFATGKVYNANMLKASTYMEYLQGRVDNIFGGCFGDYDYNDDAYKARVKNRPYMTNAFVHIRPVANVNSVFQKVFGAGEGYPGDRLGDEVQDFSYVLVDIPQGMENFKLAEVFGAGSYNGLGMRTYVAPDAAVADRDKASAIIDLVRGQIGATYGGSYDEGVTRRTMVNVPTGSTIQLGSIFGGAYGMTTLNPCDVYESNVNYQSSDALMIYNPSADSKLRGSLYGGNNNERRTLYAKVNLNVPLRMRHFKYGMTTGYVYGAGCGANTWCGYTEVNLEDGAQVYEVYGGGEAGKIYNAASCQKFQNTNPFNVTPLEDWAKAWTLKEFYEPAVADMAPNQVKYLNNTKTNLNNPLVIPAEMDGKRYNANVRIKKGATVNNYAYGGGLGADAVVAGTTYIALLGGTVQKDIYGAGTQGSVENIMRCGFDGNPEEMLFTASANVYVEGGTCRNVYGGGWAGDVGHHESPDSNNPIAGPVDNDVMGETNVVIGIRKDQANLPAGYGFYKGVPAIQRNAYGGGEGGAVFGSSHLTLNNGFIGYAYNTESGTYEPKLDDETWEDGVGKDRLKDCGNLFGGGYDDKSSVDFTNVTIWGGEVRSSVHGGGEIATVGRGKTKEDGATRTLEQIYKAGGTRIEMYNGHVLRNVFGGGKGYNLLGFGGVNELYTDGYVFGSTEVHIHGGEIGTAEGLASGYGNVFGGGDIGFVYSKGFFSSKTQAKEYTGSPGHIYYYDDEGNLTEDCKVVVTPYLQVKPGGANVTFDGKTYGPYDYVPTDYLNTLPKKSDEGTFGGGWENLVVEETVNGEKVERGIQIRNAVFGGGNVSSNSDKTYANATTVYGNTTATLYDVYHRDFITVGTEHTGGLYGGGNLSVVAGYRELNITNYGTDYYGLDSRISLDQYRALSNRERAYFQLEYVCIGNSETNASGKTGISIGGEFYENGQHLSEEKYLKLLEAHPAASVYWEPFGFCSIYAGRLLNTIQRADLCGVFGSRMVLQGAKDRVAEVGENIDYTINRVGELSLNTQRSLISSDTGDDALHGNYFGIYSLVNYMGNLTSDVRFEDEYVDGQGTVHRDQSYYSYKAGNYTSSNRNKGKSTNQVALASGVFLELTTENSTADHKDYGLVTGVVELDLINVKQDQIGGGFVYAKNEHRIPTYDPNKKNVILSEYNQYKGDIACTYKQYTYSGTEKPYETSGNFIHPSKRIVDDCYPVNNAYIIGSANYSEAHYWYVKGDVYIYDQKVSAYTGSATAYSKEVHLPLTITAASNGKLQLLNVKPNLYAYYTDKDGTMVKIGTTGADGNPIDKVMVNNESDSYELNDVITWWDWNNLSYKEKQYFVTETYVNSVDCNVDGIAYEAGTYVMNEDDFARFKHDTHTITNTIGEKVTDITEIFRSSNNIGHETGYVLTFDIDSPSAWDNYFISATGTQKITKKEHDALLAAATTDAARQAVLNAWREGPTFTPATSGVYGQRQYGVGEIITEEVYKNNKVGSGKQAKVEKAYVATEAVTYTYNGITKTVNPGAAIPESEYNAIGTAKSSFGSAWVCTNTVKLSDDNYVLNGDLFTTQVVNEMKTNYPALLNDINSSLTPAYICSEEGGYGGQQFDAGTNYSAIKTWCSLPESDRYDADGNEQFAFNHDALDLLTDPEFLKVDESNERTPADAYHSPYSDQVNVEYQAVFKATPSKPTLTYAGGTLTDGQVISNEVFENSIRNDQRHYTRLAVKAGGEDFYIANTNFVYEGTPFGKGQVVNEDIYTFNTSSVDKVKITNNANYSDVKYYCYEDYEGVAKGTTIDEAAYASLTNDQRYFIIQGREPTETTTLYVSRESDIRDVTKEKVYTVVYQYTYYENEDDGSVKLTNELHVINVHLQLESGVPQIGTLSPPATVLPGNTVGLKAPEVQPGLYEVLTSGWELFTNIDDADNHRNGVPFVNNSQPFYWYQNGKNYVAFYSKTYLGKTYSNAVPLSVANYHDLDAVMKDKEHHLYIDKATVDRPSKIYIDDRACQSDATKSELDLLKDFFDLSLQTSVATTGATADHALLDNHVHAGRNLEFFLNSDVSPKAYTDWVPIGNDNTSGTAGQCFEGTLHGDGHTVTGLNNSLFGHLCGEVYNLGVTGSFSSAGIADTGDGYVENSWVKTTGTPDGGVNAVFGNPSDTKGKQVVNCYYSEDNHYSKTDNGRGLATPMAEKAFYNGTVAYNLNGFYLNKRFYDNNTSWTGTKKSYKYLKQEADGTLIDEAATGQYPDSYALYPLDGEKQYGYVEDRYSNVDFLYSNGSLPSGPNVRMRIETEGEGDEAVESIHYYPIWPDDYIFFGQALTYGYDTSMPHDELPSSITKSNSRLATDNTSNRVYRAPAYFGNSTMSVAHFNPAAYFVTQTKPVAGETPHEAYPGLTAIDFAGHNDRTKGYQQGMQNGNAFPPLLDDDGLVSIATNGITRNLLVYAPEATANLKTHDVLVQHFAEPDFSDYYVDNAYRSVKVLPVSTTYGHLVQGDLTATNDHLLVDNEEFNCPIAYTFADDKRMWFQRKPASYVNMDDNGNSIGWNDIALPFRVELVTTPDKGEISHFYGSSTKGHEYWLREFQGIGSESNGITKANLGYPAADASSEKLYTNTFLWDYYYSANEGQDVHNDEYQQNYYKSSHYYGDYAMQQAGTPYVIGLPGSYYYEFDLSGQWQAINTASPAPAKLSAQTITYASEAGGKIGVSDNEMKKVTYSGYTFCPTYKNTELPAGAYLLNAEGSKFEKTDAATTLPPFHTYFVASAAAGARTRSIIFNDNSLHLGDESTPTHQGENLIISSDRHKIIVQSKLHLPREVRIVNPAGITVNSFTIQPGETIETRIINSGVFIVQTIDGQYTKKLTVR